MILMIMILMIDQLDDDDDDHDEELDDDDPDDEADEPDPTTFDTHLSNAPLATEAAKVNCPAHKSIAAVPYLTIYHQCSHYDIYHALNQLFQGIYYRKFDNYYSCP